MCPQLFYQLWTIHGLVHNAILPLVFVLMVRKTEQLYNRILDVLCDGRNFQPEIIITDFETAAINSIRVSLSNKANINHIISHIFYCQAHFPNAQAHGCFFHLCQSVWRKVQSLGYEHRYKTEEDFRTKIKMMVAVAFVPPADVGASFDSLMEEYDNDADLAGMV